MRVRLEVHLVRVPLTVRLNLHLPHLPHLYQRMTTMILQIKLMFYQKQKKVLHHQLAPRAQMKVTLVIHRMGTRLQVLLEREKVIVAYGKVQWRND